VVEKLIEALENILDLTDDEVETLTDYLLKQQADAEAQAE
jgi:hypothetical protein